MSEKVYKYWELERGYDIGGKPINQALNDTWNLNQEKNGIEN